MGRTLTIRLTDEIFEWLKKTSRRSGIPAGRIIREKLEQAKADDRNNPNDKPWMKLVGSVRGLSRDLSTRKGFSRK